jgi:hypothetical protein
MNRLAVVLLMSSFPVLAHVPRPTPGPVVRPHPPIHVPTPGPVVRPR